MQLRPGEIVDGYRIQRPIGRGGMGAVYLAEHLSLRRPVALKIVTAALAEDPAFRERFEREARLAARLDHPNVVTVYDAGVHEAGPWLAMRYVDGQDLSRRLRAAEGGRSTPETAVRVIEQVAAGLDHAHAAGLVHRDVKPANVLIEDGDAGRALLADFGLTKEVDDAADDLTATGVVVGSVDYLAPERIAHGHVDGRADVYALAAMLWTLLTGRPPFDGQTATKLYRHVHAPRPEPSRLDPGLAGFDAVVARGMAIDPDQRYASAGDLAVAARAALEGRPPVVTERIVARGAAAPAPVDEAADGIVLHRRRPAADPPTPAHAQPPSAATVDVRLRRPSAPVERPSPAAERVPPPVIRAPAPPAPVRDPVARPGPAPRRRGSGRAIAIVTALAVLAVGGGTYLLARDDGSADRSGGTTEAARTNERTPAEGSETTRRTAVARQVAELMGRSATGRALTVRDPQAALDNRRLVLRRLTALRPADGRQRAAISAFRQAMRASIDANRLRISGSSAAGADGEATRAKQRFCQLWSSSGMASAAHRPCDPGRI